MNKYLTPATAPGPEVLTRKEYKVLQHLVTGKRNKDIAEELNVSKRTIETFRAHILKKLQLGTVPDLVFYAIRHRIIDSEGNLTSQIWASYPLSKETE